MSRSIERRSLSILGALLLTITLAEPALAVGACNSVGCWSMKILTLKATGDGKVWVTFETDPIDPLHDGGSFSNCTVRLVAIQGNHPALLVASDQVGADDIYTQLLLAFASRQPVGFNVGPGNLSDAAGVPYCAFTGLYFYRPDCDKTTAVCQ